MDQMEEKGVLITALVAIVAVVGLVMMGSSSDLTAAVAATYTPLSTSLVNGYPYTLAQGATTYHPRAATINAGYDALAAQGALYFTVACAPATATCVPQRRVHCL